MATYFDGITVPTLVPCGSDGRMDEDAFCRHIRFLESAGISGLFVGGTTGEFINYASAERQRQLALAVQCAGKMRVLYNITSMNEREMARHIRFAAEHGVGCVSVTAPYYHKYDRAALMAFFSRVSCMTEGMALFIYNMPDMTGNPVQPDMLEELTEKCPNLRGIKDSSMSFTNLQELFFRAPEGFEVITGNDAEILASLQLGCKGVIVALANVYPEFCLGVYESFRAGDLNKARRYQRELIRLRCVCRSVMPIMSHKYLLQLRGQPMGPAHFPLRELTAEEKARLQAAAEHAAPLLEA